MLAASRVVRTRCVSTAGWHQHQHQQQQQHTQQKRWEHRTALVVGGTRGIGFQIAASLLQQNYAVAIAGRDKQRAEEAALKLGERCRGFACDVTNPHSVNAVLQQVEHDVTIGPLDVVVNSAGISIDALLVRARDEDIHQVITTNVLGSLYVCRAACRTMMRRRRGNIITIGSIAASTANVGQVVYATSKSALVGMTATLAREMAPKGIRVNLVSPGFVATDMTQSLLQRHGAALTERIPLRRIGTSSDVAQAVHMVLNTSYMTGQEIVVDGGYSL